jgi:hypothetical protein
MLTGHRDGLGRWGDVSVFLFPTLAGVLSRSAAPSQALAELTTAPQKPEPENCFSTPNPTMKPTSILLLIATILTATFLYAGLPYVCGMNRVVHDCVHS